jgi:hypothetical protein
MQRLLRAVRVSTATIALGVAPSAMAQGIAAQPHMAPIARYLTADRAAEIALARSAAPKAISGGATIMVLERQGYEQSVHGQNGFVCLVERSWTSPFDSPGFWNPAIRGPACYNPAGARSVLPGIYMRTQLALAGLSKDQILDSIRVAFAAHRLPSPEPGAMAYMMSKLGRVGAHAVRWLPHLMFELPRAAHADWGANAAGSPILLHQDTLDPIMTEFLIPVGTWSDGTPARSP